MENNKIKIFMKRSAPLFLVFFVSFAWFFMLTYNFPFIWEDTWVFSAYEASVQHPESVSLKERVISLVKHLTNPSGLYTARYLAKPLNEFYVSVIGSTFGLTVLYHRLAKAFFVGILFVFIFLFIKQIGKTNDVPISLGYKNLGYKKYLNVEYLSLSLFIMYFLMLPEFWIMILNIVDSLLFALLLEIITLFLFFFYYNNERITNKIIVTIFFLSLVFLTHATTLIRHLGRINFLLFFLFLLITDKKKIITWRYGLLLAILFVISVPVLGILGFGDTHDAVGITEHTGKQGFIGLLSLASDFLKTVHLSFFPHAFFL